MGPATPMRNPLAQEKIEGPSTKLEIFGIVIDLISMELSLPGRKLVEIKATLMVRRGRKSATKAEIQSLAGELTACSQGREVW